jgi:adenylate cyclase
MLSESTKSLADGLFVTRELDAIQVMGKQKPVHVYELLGKKGEVAENKLATAMLFEEALANYRKGDFTEAKTLFAEVLNLIPDDPPSIEFLRRIEVMDEKVPQGGWNGVFKADSKG